MDSLAPKTNKPETIVGKILVWGGIIAGGFYLAQHMTEIITFLQNVYYAGALAGGLVLVYLFFSNKKIRTALGYVWQSLIRKVIGIIIETDPIAILKGYIEKLREKIEKIDEQLTLLSGQLGRIKMKIEEKMKICKKELAQANEAQKLGKDYEPQARLHSTNAARHEEFIKKIQALYTKMNLLYQMLNQMRRYSDIMVQNTACEVELKEEEYNLIKKSHNIMKTAFSIIKGDNDEKLLFDQSMEEVLNQTGTRIGEMQRMMDASTDFIKSVDLEDASYADDGLKLLEEFQKKGLDSIFGTGTTATTTANPVTLNTGGVQMKSKYEDIF